MFIWFPSCLFPSAVGGRGPGAGGSTFSLDQPTLDDDLQTMAELRLRVGAPALRLLAALVLCGLRPAAPCTPLCLGGVCVTVHRDSVDFPTAQDTCGGASGELLTVQSATDETLLQMASRGLGGQFWLGLRLPENTCSDVTAALRGYEWTSASGTFVPAVTAWRQRAPVCSPRCVCVSDGGEWAERRCSDKADGFLCRSTRRDACRAQEVSAGGVFLSPKGCSEGPCEHQCSDVPGGFRCSCFPGFAADSEDPRRCSLHCAQQTCRAVCVGGHCSCAEGFILDGAVCRDIDECLMGQCSGGCTNSFGGFVCSCSDGFLLNNHNECVPAGFWGVTTAPAEGVVKPAANHTLGGSSLASGGFLWVWVSLAAALLVVVCAVRSYVVKRQKQREQTSGQRSTVEC